MAIVTCYTPVNMYASSSMPGNATITSTTPTVIQASFGAYSIRMHGNYSYNTAGQLTGGTFTGMDVSYRSALQYSVSGLSIDVYSLVYNPAASTDAAIFSRNDTFNGSFGIDVLRAYNGNDVLYGNGGNDRLAGDGGNDILYGGTGRDILNGGTGMDRMVGGSGNDSYYVDNARDVVVETSAVRTEIDNVVSSVNYSLKANFENLTLNGTAIKGTGNVLNNTITGNAANNVLSGGTGSDRLSGGAGNDILNGGTGADRMIGGTGNDTYYVDNIRDVVVEASASGTDRVVSSASHTLGANVENLTLSGSAAINGTGNTLSNTIIGNAAANTLNGRAGNDIIKGGGGNDTIKGEAGDDTLIGGAGNDILIGGTGTDTFVGGAGDDTYYVNDSLPAVTLNIVGQPGNYVSGGTNTTYTSVTGTWYVPQQFDFNGDGSTDYMYFFYQDNTLGKFALLTVGTNQLGTNLSAGTYLNAERASFANSGAPGLDFDMDGRGNNEVWGSFTIYSIDIDYSAATPTLRSLSMTFSQSGLPTEPPLTGTFNYNLPGSPPGEQVTERANEGTDHVISSVSYALSANVENLTLSGAAAINGTGNELDNVITGNGAVNTLTGGLGKDTLTGGLGADTFDFNALAESAVGANCDTITDFVCGTDKIDLSTIDAIVGGGTADDAFAFIDTAAFSGAGQLRFENGVLYGNVDADLAADFQISLTGVATFAATDVLL
jgi:Ca2+-binding RTX toxin-like protein